MSQSDDSPKTIPPYVSWTTFINFVNRLKQAVPRKVDRTIMKDMSGSGQAQLLHALRYLKLIDDDEGKTLPLFDELANTEPDARTEIYRRMLYAAYPFLSNADFKLEIATPGDLKTQFVNMGAKADSARKCQSFFLAMVNAVGLTVSPHIKSAPKAAPGTARPKRAKSKKAKAEAPGTNPTADNAAGGASKEDFYGSLLDKLPTFDPTWPPEAVTQWLAAMNAVEKAKRAAGGK